MGFTKRDNQLYINPVRRAILTHNLIEPGDRIGIGMSGGKDSTFLFYVLSCLKEERRLSFDFDIVPISLDMAMGSDVGPLEDFVQDLGYNLDVVPTEIGTIVFGDREEKYPCSLCANLRRGILNNRAKELGCNKVALGHHVDDAIETYLMNFLFHGKLKSFEPMSHLSRVDLHLVRPLIYLEEERIKRFVIREKFPVIFNPCPVDKKTKREEMKQLVSTLSLTYPDIRKRFVQGMEQGTIKDFWGKKFN